MASAFVALGALALVVPAVLSPDGPDEAGAVVEVPAAPTTPASETRDATRDPASRSGRRTATATPSAPATTTAPEPSTAPPATKKPARHADASPAPTRHSSSPRATSAPSSSPTTQAGPTIEDEIVALTNEARRDAGLEPLEVSTCAADQAASRTAVLVAEGRFEHDPLEPILRDCGSRSVGENLALGYPTAQATVDGWLDSPGHRDNLLGDFTEIGVGCTDSDRGPLCAQVFLG